MICLKNSSLTQDQIIEYCNNQIIETENIQNSVNVRTILLNTGLVIAGTCGIWLIVRRRGKGRIEEASAGLNSEVMINNNRQEEDHNWFTPKKVLVYCVFVGLISAPLFIFIDWLGLLSMADFVFASITG
jgi:hypothetical protein